MVQPRPFLKWVGGKGQLLPDLVRQVLRAKDFGRYHEPFVGGGALFFELARSGKLGDKTAYLSDNNSRLIDAYQAVKEDPDRVIALLLAHRERHGKEYYYSVRATVPEGLFERAARIIYLNRTCFNGLFRENSRGLFNVPFGRYVNPTICDEANLRAVSSALRLAKVEVRSFETVLGVAEPGDLVYFDPPYHPLSRTSSFTAYDRGGFGEDMQRKLSGVAHALAARNVRVLLSNSMTDFVRELYGDDFVIDEVQATRAVNSRADRRGKISEALIRNF